jgi:hypothetical protein
MNNGSPISWIKPTTLIHVEDPRSPVAEALRVYLLDLGIKTLLVIPLPLGGQANGQLSFRFIEERDFGPEELEVARALANPSQPGHSAHPIGQNCQAICRARGAK